MRIGQTFGADNTRNESTVASTATLERLVDSLALQSIMDDFYALTSIPMALIGLDGAIIVGAGWQEVCTRFHRANPDTCTSCVESDTVLSRGIPAGESRLYKCKNGMWDAAMPVFVGDEHVANVFTGQFFFDDERIDLDLFRAQAVRHGFPEDEYLDSIQSVHRLSRDTVQAGLSFLTKLAAMLSRLSFTNSTLASLVHEHQILLEREREQADRLRTLAEIESVLTSSLDFEEVIDLALTAAETHLRVAASSVWTVDVTGERLCLVGYRGFPDSFTADFADGISVGDAYPVARAASGAAPVLYECVADASLHDPVRDAYARYGVELGSLAAIPLIAKDVVIGGMTLAWSSQRSFDPDDIVLINTLARRFSAAMENAQLFQSEHMIAETLQETLVALPSHVAGVSFSSAYESSTHHRGRVGGDFIDIFEIQGDMVGITLGDVSGKGIEAAATTSLVRTTLRVHALDGLPPAEVAGKTNQVVRRFTEAESFVTLWFGVLDTKTGELRYFCAGHPPALVISADGDVRELDGLDSILGAFDGATFVERRTTLSRGDRLLVYSDGATEARSPEGGFLGEDGLRAVVERHKRVPTPGLSGALVRDIVAHGKGVLRDDVAILAVEPVELT